MVHSARLRVLRVTFLISRRMVFRGLVGRHTFALWYKGGMFGHHHFLWCGEKGKPRSRGWLEGGRGSHMSKEIISMVFTTLSERTRARVSAETIHIPMSWESSLAEETGIISSLNRYCQTKEPSFTTPVFEESDPHLYEFAGVSENKGPQCNAQRWWMFEGIAVPKYETLVFLLEMSLDSNIELPCSFAF